MMFIKRALIGVIIGIASITPGVSGGVLAAAIGVYEPAIRAISTIRKKFKENTLFLLPLGIGAGAGVLLFSNVMKYLFAHWSHEVLYLFFGLVTGSIPSVLHIANENGFKLRNLWASAAAFGLVTLLAYLERFSPGTSVEADWSILSGIFYGIILAVGTIIPGISTSFILIYLGAYDDLLTAIAMMDVMKLIPVAIGFCAGVLPLVKLVQFLFEKFRAVSYYGVLGFLIASMAAVFPGVRTGWQLLADMFLFSGGIVASMVLLSINRDKGKT